MAVTETIQELLQGIDEAQYGRDMRQFIHKAIQKCYEEGSAGETDLVAREAIDDINDRLGSGEIGDAYLMPMSFNDSDATTNHLTITRQLIVFPSIKMAHLNVRVKNESASSAVDNWLLVGRYLWDMPMLFLPTGMRNSFPLYNYASTDNTAAPVLRGVLTNCSSRTSATKPYTGSGLAFRGSLDANAFVEGNIAFPYIKLADNFPISSGEKINYPDYFEE